MPRKARIDAPGALHHVIVRGIERGKIFRSDYDRRNFLNRLGKLIPETQIDYFAWALIPNHAHLLLRTGLIPVCACPWGRSTVTNYNNSKYKSINTEWVSTEYLKNNKALIFIGFNKFDVMTRYSMFDFEYKPSYFVNLRFRREA